MHKILQKPVETFMTKNVIAIDRKSTIKNLFPLFEQHGIMGVPVVDERKKVLGMVTESDMLKHLSTFKTPRAIHVLGSLLYLEDVDQLNENLKKHCAGTAEAIMSQPAICLRPEQTLQEAIDLMTDKKISRLPVVDKNGILLGIVTRTDLVHQLSHLKAV